MAKLAKFQTIQSQIDRLASAYEEARKKKNRQVMSLLEEEYADAKISLYSNEHYFKKLDESLLNDKIQQETDEKRKKQLIAELRQKQVYADNVDYIEKIASTSSLKEYNKNKNSKKRKIVNRKFKQGILAVSLVAVLAVTGCFSKKQAVKKGSDSIEKTTEVTEDNSNKETEVKEETITISSNKEDSKEDNKDENKNKKTENKRNSIIPESVITVIEQELTPEFPSSTPSVPTTVVIKEDNVVEPTPIPYPGMEDTKPTPVIDNTKPGEIVIPEENKPEPTPVPYPGMENTKPNSIDNTKPSDNKTPAEAAGNNIEEDEPIPYIPKDDKIDPNCPPAGELPEKEKVNKIEKEIKPSITPAEAAGNNIDETDYTNPNTNIDSSTTPSNNTTNNTKPSITPAEAAGDIIDETDFGDEDIKYYYESEPVLNLEDEVYTLILK